MDDSMYYSWYLYNVHSQVEFAIKCIKHMQKKKAAAIEPKESAVDEFVGKLKKSFDGTVWTSGCKSWYMNEEGQVRKHLFFIHLQQLYWRYILLFVSLMLFGQVHE